jgi:uncharacterized membrane-anchored protein
MQDQHVPAIGRYYWPAFWATSLFGISLGNLTVDHLAPRGLVGLYLPFLALAFAAILFAEVRDPAPSARWYWLAVIIVPGAANHLADLSFFYLGIRRIWVCAILLVVLVITHLAFQSDTTRLIALRLQERPKPTVPLTDATYWIAMVVASTAGNLASDFLSIGRGLDLGVVCLLLLLPVAAAAALRRWTSLHRTGTYWSVVVALNAFATAMSDLLAGNPTHGLGVLWSAILSAVVMAALLYLASQNESSPQRAP